MKKFISIIVLILLWSGNSFALSPEYKKEIYNNCYQDSKLSLGAKRAKQYCTCTTTMLDNKYSDEDILSIGQKSEAEQIQAFAFASNHCNKNANAPKSSSDNSSSGKYPILKCTIEHSGDTIVKVHDLNVQKTNRKISENYIEWRTVPLGGNSGELTLLDHSADRRTGNYIVEMTIMKSGEKNKNFTYHGTCEAGSNEKLF